MNAIGQGPSHCRARLERAQDGDGFDSGARQFRCHVVGNAGQSDDLDVQSLACSYHRFQVGAAVVLKANRERSTGHRLPHGFGMQCKLVSKCRSHEVRAVRIEALLDQQVDVTQIDHADIDRHLLRLARALPVFNYCSAALHVSHLESIWNPIGA